MKTVLANLLPFVAYPYRGERTSCDLCGSAATLDICRTDRRWKPLRTVVCADCGLLRTDPMPTQAELDAYYAKTYRFDYQLALREPPKFHLVRSRREAAERARLLARWLTPGSRVLDLGCGTGEFLAQARSRGCIVVGIEPGEDYAARARATSGAHVETASWREARFPARGFDLITTHHVLEHLRDPVQALAALAGWLAPEGRLHVGVPDMRPNGRPSFERFHFAHVHGFTPETLQVAAAACGLVPEDGHDLATTVAVFRHATAAELAAARARMPLREAGRAERLRAGYREASIAAHVASGAWLQAAARRFAKWRRDTFGAEAAPEQASVPEFARRSSPEPERVG